MIMATNQDWPGGLGKAAHKRLVSIARASSDYSAYQRKLSSDQDLCQVDIAYSLSVYEEVQSTRVPIHDRHMGGDPDMEAVVGNTTENHPVRSTVHNFIWFNFSLIDKEPLFANNHCS